MATGIAYGDVDLRIAIMLDSLDRLNLLNVLQNLATLAYNRHHTPVFMDALPFLRLPTVFC
jgi:hypothetical protein